MRVSHSVRAVQVPDDNPMHPQFTTMYLVGHGQVLAIDTGERVERYQWMMRGYLAAMERAEIALATITHNHADHSGNLIWFREVLNADILVHESAPPLLQGRLPETGVSYLRDGQVIELDGGVRVTVLHTPGHSPDSVSFYLESEGVLLTGDTILGATTVTISDLYDYMRSLERLKGLPNLQVICPGHGPLVTNPREWIQEYIDHRNMRERQILEVLAQGGPLTSWDIMMRIYTDVDPRLRRAADGNVRTHLRKLEREGRIKVYPGKPKERSPEEVAREAEEERQRQETLARARELEERERRRRLFAQENPPLEQWEEPPRYELER